MPLVVTAEKDDRSTIFWQAKFSPWITGHRYVYCGNNVGCISSKFLKYFV